MRELTTTAREFDPAEIWHGAHSATGPSIRIAVLPLVLVVAVSLTLSQIVLPNLDFDFLSEPQLGATSLAAVGGVWSVAVTMLAVCGTTHKDSYLDIVMVAVVGALLGLVAVIVLGTLLGSI